MVAGAAAAAGAAGAVASGSNGVSGDTAKVTLGFNVHNKRCLSMKQSLALMGLQNAKRSSYPHGQSSNEKSVL